MRANTLIKVGTGVWATMMVLSILHPAVLASGRARDAVLDAMVAVAAWQSMAMVVAIFVAVLRTVLDRKLSGAARWLGWIPVAGSGLVLVTFSVFGHIVG